MIRNKLSDSIFKKPQLDFGSVKDLKYYEQVPGINYDIVKRWEEGLPHHPKSEELYNRIARLDFCVNNDFFCWKSGGDGDNGEALMYLLDIIFEEKGKVKGDRSNL